MSCMDEISAIWEFPLFMHATECEILGSQSAICAVFGVIKPT